MLEAAAPEQERTCFVVMGFGKKTDYQAEPIRQLDLDKTYRAIIKPAAEEAGLKCVRADELVHSGLIDLAMYEQLLSADVVIADLSTSNSNAFYELGVRHALRPYTTIVICENGLTKEGRDKLPFDVNHVLVLKYRHDGTALDYDEVLRFKQVLKDAIVKILDRNPPASDSPVYTFLRGLNPPGRAAEGVGRELDEALGGEQPEAAPSDPRTHSELMRLAEDAQLRGEFDSAKAMLGVIKQMRPDDPEVTQRLAVATYRCAKPTRRAALEEARELLRPLRPEVSSDPWTLGIWGTVHERLWKETGDAAQLDEALAAYARSFAQRRDYFNGIHYAFLLNARAAQSKDRAEAIADFVLARRVRREVIASCHEWLAAKQPGEEGGDKNASNERLEESSWALATLAEAHMGTGDAAAAQQYYDESEAVIRQLEQDGYPAFKVGSMRAAVQAKRAELKAMLADSPLKYVKTEGA